MALVLADRVLETTGVTGTGDASLNGAQTNFQPFSVVGNGSTTYYTIVDNTNNEWEVGIGTYISAGNKLSRDTVLSSSNGGALVYFASGTKDIFCDLPAEKVASTGAVIYKGTWNASTNTPALTSSVGTQGDYYIVSVAGSTDLNGITDWKVGDWAIFNGSVWQKVDNTDLVTSVNGQTGAVVLTASDVGAAPATSGTSILYGNGSGGFSNVTVGTGLSFTGGTLATSGGGAGDVTGPASSTDNAITRFDSTTGKVIQNSTVTLDDDGNVINVNSIGLDTTPGTVPATVGTMSWDDGDGVPSVLLKGGLSTLQVGTQEYARVYNDSGTTLTRGQVVYISGAQGNRVAVNLAKADVEATSFGTIGLVSETIASGAEGFIIVSGALYKLNTLGLTAGAAVYLSPTTAGAFTTTKPQAPDQLVVIGWIERVSTTVGSIYVKIDNGYELDELHDVLINSPTSGNTLIYDAVVGVWKNANLTDGTGISITEGAGSITITNSAPDQTVSLTAGTGMSVTGTYPSFTLTNIAPDQVVSLTGAGTTTVTGTYPSFTITSNDAYVGTVTSVGGTGSVNGITLTGTVTTSGNLTLGGTLSGIGNSQLTNSSVTFNGVTVALGASGTITAANPNALSAGTGLSFTGAGTYDGSAAKTLNLANTAVTAGSYTYGSFTVDAQGRLTAASSGTAPVTSVSGTGVISSSGGTTPTISISQATTSTSGYLSSTDWNTFNNKGSGTVTSITAGTGLSGGTITGSGTIALANTAVTAGSYTNASITVDAQGRLTAASSGSGGGVTSLNGQTGDITNTSLYAIGSYVVGRPQNSTVYAVNSTLAGSSLYATCSNISWAYTASQWRTYTNGTSLSGGTTLVNTGTWRCMSPAGTSPGDGTAFPGLWVRIS